MHKKSPLIILLTVVFGALTVFAASQVQDGKNSSDEKVRTMQQDPCATPTPTPPTE